MQCLTSLYEENHHTIIMSNMNAESNFEADIWAFLVRHNSLQTLHFYSWERRSPQAVAFSVGLKGMT